MSNEEIRKITPAGAVTTLAGAAGQSGSADGAGSRARFTWPSGVAVDSAGNVYVADSGNDDIRKITPAGVVTTLAGAAGQTGSADDTGSAARFNQPAGVAVDSAGNVYVADASNYEIRKITPAGVVTTLAGAAGKADWANGTGNAARFYYPEGVAVDGAGNVYVADYKNNEIRKMSPATAPTSQVTIRSSQSTRPMSLGGTDTDCAGINLTDAELARIVTSSTGTITIGDAAQSGAITFHTARPATTARAAVQVIEDPASGGQIVLDNGVTGTAWMATAETSPSRRGPAGLWPPRRATPSPRSPPPGASRSTRPARLARRPVASSSRPRRRRPKSPSGPRGRRRPCASTAWGPSTWAVLPTMVRST